jgi:uncharacterized protein with HEPN domain
MTTLIETALLGLIEEAGTAVAILTEGLERAELLRSRLTRAQVLQQLKTLSNSMAQVAPAARQELPELDWSGWDALNPRLNAPPGEVLDEALWFASEAMVPATLLWLRVYRQNQPELFRMAP